MDEKNGKNERTNEQIHVDASRNTMIESHQSMDICECNDSAKARKKNNKIVNDTDTIRLRHHIMACLTLLWSLAILRAHTHAYSNVRSIIIIIVAVGDK